MRAHAARRNRYAEGDVRRSPLAPHDRTLSFSMTDTAARKTLETETDDAARATGMVHTVEKIGGTSMSRARELMDTILIGDRDEESLYGRAFVVSAFGDRKSVV